MLPYKNYKSDLKGKYEKYLKISLAFTLLLVIAAFKFAPSSVKAPVTKPIGDDVIFIEPEMNTVQKTEPPPMPKPVEPVITYTDEPVDIELVDVSINVNDHFEKPPAIEKEKIIEEEFIPYRLIEKKPVLIEGKEYLQSIKYPEIIKRTGIEGKVVVEFIVDKKGNVESAKVIESVNEQLDEICLNAVNKLKFSPGLQRDKPVKVKMHIPITFSLK